MTIGLGNSHYCVNRLIINTLLSTDDYSYIVDQRIDDSRKPPSRCASLPNPAGSHIRTLSVTPFQTKLVFEPLSQDHQLMSRNLNARLQRQHSICRPHSFTKWHAGSVKPHYECPSILVVGLTFFYSIPITFSAFHTYHYLER